MTEVISPACRPRWPAILSGPSFAEEVARGLPAAVTLAAREENVGRNARARARLGHVPSLSFDRRARRRDRGAAKNVLAIAAGIVAGRGLGASASGGAHHARLRRALSIRPGPGGEAGDLDGPRRSG